MVFATAVPNMNAATKLANAAKKTAPRIDKTRVATIVEIEFAASLKPFPKSKTKARIIIINAIISSAMFYYDALNNHGDIFHFIGY